MSTKIKKPSVNRTELRVMILRMGLTMREFCKKQNFFYNSFQQYMLGREDLTKINKKVVKVMVQNGYNPYTQTPELVLTDQEQEQLLRMV